MILLALLCWLVLILMIAASYGAFAAPVILAATICAADNRSDCTAEAWHFDAADGYCDGAGPLNSIIGILKTYAPGRTVVVREGSIQCRSAS